MQHSRTHRRCSGANEHFRRRTETRVPRSARARDSAYGRPDEERIMATLKSFDLDDTIAGTNTAIAFTEGAGAMLLAAHASVTGTGNFGGQTLTISGLLPEDEIGFASGVMVSGKHIRIAGTKVASISGGNGGSDLVITFDDGAVAQDVQTLLRNLTFVDTSHNPTLHQTLTINLAGTIRTDEVTITPVNDAPVLTAGGTLHYAENDAATPINASLSVADVDSAKLTGASVSITGNFASGQDVLGFVNQNGISGSYNAATGVLTLSGSSSVANYQAALRSVTYFNTSDNPSAAARTISFQVDDGAAANHASNVATTSVDVTRVNDAPVVDLNGAPSGTSTALSYHLGDALTAIAPVGTVADVDSTDFNGGSLRIEFTLNGDATDRLAILTDGVVTLGGGGTVMLNGTPIGMVSGGGAGT